MATTDDRGERAAGSAFHRRDARHDDDESRRIEQILRREEPLDPSPGFSLRVMAALRQEAALPPPIAFPWRPLLTGLAACALLTAAGGAALLRSAAHFPLPALPAPGLRLPPLDPSFLLAGGLGLLGPLGWAAAALAGTYLLTRLSRQLLKA
jgi:hypothetical protein